MREFADLTSRVAATGHSPRGFRSAARKADRVATSSDARGQRALRQLDRMTRHFATTGRHPRGFRIEVIRAFTAVAQRDLHGYDPSPPPRLQHALVREFFRLYYHSRQRTWLDTYFLGTRILKNPLDLWVYQELLHEVRPDVIVETGTKYGGSASFLAHMCDLLGQGRIVTIDIQLPPDTTEEMLPKHPRITYVRGSSTDPDVVDQVTRSIGKDEKVLVILDSDHSRQHVYAELLTWADKVQPESYVIVEDTVSEGKPVGAMLAVRDFLAKRDDFVVDESREKFFMTFNPSGYLRRVSKPGGQPAQVDPPT